MTPRYELNEPDCGLKLVPPGSELGQNDLDDGRYGLVIGDPEGCAYAIKGDLNALRGFVRRIENLVNRNVNVSERTERHELEGDQARSVPREHRWSTEVKVSSPPGDSEPDTWTRLCTRPDCGIAESSHSRRPQPCEGDDDPPGEHIMSTYADRHISAQIVATGATFELRWNDWILNEWVESFHLLPVAFARLATLIHCVQSQSERMFTAAAEQFAVTAMEFHDSNTATPGFDLSV